MLVLDNSRQFFYWKNEDVWLIRQSIFGDKGYKLQTGGGSHVDLTYYRATGSIPVLETKSNPKPNQELLDFFSKEKFRDVMSHNDVILLNKLRGDNN